MWTSRGQDKVSAWDTMWTAPRHEKASEWNYMSVVFVLKQ